MTDKAYRRASRRIKSRNDDLLKKQELQEERNKYKPVKRKETSKKLTIYLFVLLNTIIIYAMVAMWHFGDLSYLGVLISDIAAQVVVFAIYCAKAYFGKKAEEDMRFERDKEFYTADDTADDVEPTGEA